MRAPIYFLAGFGAAVVVIHGYMRGWNRVFDRWEKLIGRST